MVMYNRLALDYLLAREGGVCAIQGVFPQTLELVHYIKNMQIMTS